MAASFAHTFLFFLSCFSAPEAASALAKVVDVPTPRVALSIDKEGTGSLLRSEASSKFWPFTLAIAASPENPDGLGDIAFYVLNLDRRKEDKLVRLENNIGSEAPWMINRTCRVSAPDGRFWGSDLDHSIITDEAWKYAIGNTESGLQIVGGPVTKGAVALMVGHGLIWEHIVSSGAAFGVVMEDGISSIHPQAKSFLERLRANESLQQGWDFLLLQSAGHRVQDVERPIAVEVGQHDYNTAMYIIKSEAAQKALRSIFPIGQGRADARRLDAENGPLWSTLRGAVTSPAVAEAEHRTIDVQQKLLARDQRRFAIPDCPALDPSSMAIPRLLSPIDT